MGGKLSGGKTTTGTRFSIDKAMKEKKKIISNIRLFNLPEGIEFLWLPNEEFIKFLKLNYRNEDALMKMFFNSVLFLDEIVNIISARKSSTNLNEIVTNFLMMTGKLDCDVVYTYQVQESQVDKRLREIANIYANCYRVDRNLQPLINKPRIVNEKVYILVIMELDFDIAGKKYTQMLYDPSPYYKFFNTREMNLTDTSKFMRGGIYDLRKMSEHEENSHVKGLMFTK